MTIVCFGEMLLRLAPADGAALDAADGLSLHVAGAEANVAISLASLGTAARMATILPDNALGARALRTLTRHGVDTAACARRPGRMGLFYIESPRAGREGGFFYDRAGSAFAREAAAIDWDAALEGANWLHLSGLTAALGNEAVSAMRQAVANARRRDLSISFDCNFRPLLWQGREAEAAGLLREFAGAAHLLFASDWDAGLLLGEEIAIDVPVRLLHGQRDDVVSWRIALDLLARLRSADVQLTLVKDGDHRLSRDGDIALLIATVEALCSRS